MKAWVMVFPMKVKMIRWARIIGIRHPLIATMARHGCCPATLEPALRVDGIQRAARASARPKGLAALSDEQLGQQPASAQAALK